MQPAWMSATVLGEVMVDTASSQYARTDWSSSVGGQGYDEDPRRAPGVARRARSRSGPRAHFFNLCWGWAKGGMEKKRTRGDAWYGACENLVTGSERHMIVLSTNVVTAVR